MPEVCLVVPCYNEAGRFRGQDILDFLQSHPAASCCLVDDGSGDATRDVLEETRRRCPERVIVLALPSNRGKAEAVREGVRHAAARQQFAFIGYWDADLSTPLGELDRLLEAFAINPDCQLAMASRVKRFGSTIERHAVRHVLGRVFATITGRMLKLPVYDSQCGAKVFRAEIVDVAFGEPFLTDWIFDVEIIARLRNRLGPAAVLKAIVEVPVTRWLEVPGSKLRLKHLLKVPMELLRVHSRYNR